MRYPRAPVCGYTLSVHDDRDLSARAADRADRLVTRLRREQADLGSAHPKVDRAVLEEGRACIAAALDAATRVRYALARAARGGGKA